MSEQQPMSRVTLFVAAGLAAVLVVGVIVASQVLGGGDTGGAAPATTSSQERTGPLALAGVDAPDAKAPECTRLVDALPAKLPSKGDELARLPLADPAPPAAAAWAGDRGEPVVLRCGLPKPEYPPTESLREISNATSTVKWLLVEGEGASTWYTVDRPVYVALTIPDDAGTGVVQEMSETIAKVLPAT